ncbi:MAG: NADAR family protein [Desulfobacterales bacterium]
MTQQKELFAAQGDRPEPEYTFFWQGPFSQWHLADITVCGRTFNCCEQFVAWSKAMLFGDALTAAKVMKSPKPREQKGLGREVEGFREDLWKCFRGGVVYTANYAKFSQHEKLKFQLLGTRGTILVEASPHDRVWGIGLSADDPKARRKSLWRGLNLLGYTLTRVREAIDFEERFAR